MQEKAQNSAESERRRLWGWQAAVSQGPGEDRCVSSQMRNRGMWTKESLQGAENTVLFIHTCFVCVHTCRAPGNILQRKDTALVLEQFTAVRGRERAE